MVVPDGHNEDHTLLDSGTHCLESTLGGELVGVSECCLLGGAEVISDGVTGDACNCGLGVRDRCTTLDIESLDLFQITIGSSIGGDELRNDSEWL